MYIFLLLESIHRINVEFSSRRAFMLNAWKIGVVRAVNLLTEKNASVDSNIKSFSANTPITTHRLWIGTNNWNLYIFTCKALYSAKK